MPWIMERIRTGLPWSNVPGIHLIDDKLQAMDALKNRVNDFVFKKEEWRYRLRNTDTNEIIHGEDFVDEHLIPSTIPAAYKKE